VAVKEKEKAGRPAPPEASTSGIPIRPYYGDPAPGEFPFTRGLSAEGYRARLWTMRQYAGFGSAQESNLRYRYLLAQGQTGFPSPSTCPLRWATTPTIRLPAAKWARSA